MFRKKRSKDTNDTQQETRQALEELLSGNYSGRKCYLEREVEGTKTHGHIENLPSRLTQENSTIEVVEKLTEKRFYYKSIDELIADGWSVG